MKIFIRVISIFSTLCLLFGRTNGLSCWFCSTLLDSNCGDDSFSGKTSFMIMKKNCSEVPAITEYRDSAEPRKVPATLCFKSKINVQGLSILTRTCASPGEYANVGLDANFVGCKTIKAPQGEAIVCQCKGDYCNGTGTPTLAAILAIISFLLILTNFISE